VSLTKVTFLFEIVAKRERRKVTSFYRNVTTGTLFQWAWVEIYITFHSKYESPPPIQYIACKYLYLH